MKLVGGNYAVTLRLMAKSPILFLMLVLAMMVVASTVHSDDRQKPASTLTFVWPRELYTISEQEWHHIKLEVAPPNFNYEGLTNEQAISWADAVYLDLRGNGHKELFINNGTGGSGGRGWSIYERTDGKWKEIGGWQGTPIICAPHNGYNQITVWSRGGGGYFSKCLLRFEGDRYHLVRLEDWKDTDDEGHRKFIGARDPKPFDN